MKRWGHSLLEWGILRSWRPPHQHFVQSFLPTCQNILETFESIGGIDDWRAVLGISPSFYAVKILCYVPLYVAVFLVYSLTKKTLIWYPQYHCGVGLFPGDLECSPIQHTQRWLCSLLQVHIVGSDPTMPATPRGMALSCCCEEMSKYGKLRQLTQLR